jgi:hypothetical protein
MYLLSSGSRVRILPGAQGLTRQNVGFERVHEVFLSLRAFRVPERLGLPSGLPSAALAFLPISIARERCRSADERS